MFPDGSPIPLYTFTSSVLEAYGLPSMLGLPWCEVMYNDGDF